MNNLIGAITREPFIRFLSCTTADSRNLAILLRIRSITHYENIELKQY